jgi:SAM-dependent methyltransferase
MRRLRRRWRLLLLTGRRVECPCCGGRFRRFMVDERRRVLVCPRCGSHERHRALWLYLRDKLRRRRLALLHWAPEPALERRLRELPELDYTSADLDPRKAMRKLDITAVDAPDASWDVILCSHVLEHVPDDRQAMRELLRVLRPGGFALLLVPVDSGRDQTFEDASLTTPEERSAAYWSEEHVRLYGRDFPRRLEEAGFDVTVERPVAGLDRRALLRHGLDPAEEIYVCRRARG